MTKNQIETYLLQNPINRSKSNPYNEAAQALGINTEKVRSVWRGLRRQGLVETYGYTAKEGSSVYNKMIAESRNQQGDTMEITKEVNERVMTLEDLIRVCEIDTIQWNIARWECNKWEVGAKNAAGEVVVTPLYQVKAKLEARKVDTDLEKQKEELLTQLFASAPEREAFKVQDAGVVRDCLYEISIPDIHFGKLAWKEETDNDYDIKIAVKRFETAVDELLSRVNLDRVEKILFPIGNDMINIDGNNSMTTAGTPQNVDSRFGKIVRVAKDLMIKTIDKLSTIAPVDVLVIPGNHDRQTMFLLGEILDAYYSKTEGVTVLNSPALRKYYKYGVNGFQYTHGDEEKHADLGLIFATERPKLWANTKYRVCKLGHLHKSKKTHYVSVDEFSGFQVEILPSLSGTDAWHKMKGYGALKAAKSYLYHKVQGKLGEFNYNV